MTITTVEDARTSADQEMTILAILNVHRSENVFVSPDGQEIIARHVSIPHIFQKYLKEVKQN